MIIGMIHFGRRGQAYWAPITHLRNGSPAAAGTPGASGQDGVAGGGDPSDYCRAIGADEWLARGAVCLGRALGEAAAAELMGPGLREIGQAALDAHAAGTTDGPYEEWSRSAIGASSNRVFARTDKGFCVLEPKTLAVGDVVMVLWGGKTCFCLRLLGSEERCLLVGECYFHGFMDGEAVGVVQRGELEEKEFETV